MARRSTFAEVTSDATMQGLLAWAHGNDVDLLDAYTGALAETEDGSALFAGPLLRVSGRKEGGDRGGSCTDRSRTAGRDVQVVCRRTASVIFLEDELSVRKDWNFFCICPSFLFFLFTRGGCFFTE